MKNYQIQIRLANNDWQTLQSYDRSAQAKAYARRNHQPGQDIRVYDWDSFTAILSIDTTGHEREVSLVA